MRLVSPKCITVYAVLPLLAGFATPVRAQGSYIQRDLVSDLPGIADHQDGNLINAWGIDHAPAGPWWVNAAGKGKSIVYDSNGNAFPPGTPVVVNVPTAPTGIVFNPTFDFPIGLGNPSLFLFATEDGNIAGWNPLVSPNAVVAVTKASASYKGLTIGMMAGHNVIYAANFAGGAVDVYDATFRTVALPAGAFHDLSVPAGFSPFNVQSVGPLIAVTYAKRDLTTGDDVAGPGNGYVVLYTGEGVPIRRLEHGKWMNSPWGVTLAPENFGQMSGRLLVGNFGSGQIASFDAKSGQFEGLMKSQKGSPIEIEGLWGLKFGNDFTAGPSNVLFFAAGIQGEKHGLFGSLTSANDPAGTLDDREHDHERDRR